MGRALATCVLLICARAAADPADDAYQQGRRYYDVQDWDAAITSFTEAYKLKPEARSLFNIAQSYRRKGDCTNALSFYRTYKRNYPTAENIAMVDRFITELDPCPVKPVEPPPPQQQQPGQPVQDPVQQPRPTVLVPTHPYRTHALIIAGSALVLGGTAVGFELSAQSTYRDSQGATGDEQISLWQSANTQRYIADGLALTSIAAVGVAVFLWFRAGEPRVEPVVSARGGGVQVGVDF